MSCGGAVTVVTRSVHYSAGQLRAGWEEVIRGTVWDNICGGQVQGVLITFRKSESESDLQEFLRREHELEV